MGLTGGLNIGGIDSMVSGAGDGTNLAPATGATFATPQSEVDSWINNPTVYPGSENIPTPIASARPNSTSSASGDPQSFIIGANGSLTMVDQNGNPVSSSGTSTTGVNGTASTGSGLLAAATTALAASGIPGISTMAGVMGAALSGTGSGSGTGNGALNISRWIAIILGLLCIAAGIFSFKQTQTVIENVTSKAEKGAEVAAAAG